MTLLSLMKYKKRGSNVDNFLAYSEIGPLLAGATPTANTTGEVVLAILPKLTAKAKTG